MFFYSYVLGCRALYNDTCRATDLPRRVSRTRKSVDGAKIRLRPSTTRGKLRPSKWRVINNARSNPRKRRIHVLYNGYWEYVAAIFFVPSCFPMRGRRPVWKTNFAPAVFRRDKTETWRFAFSFVFSYVLWTCRDAFSELENKSTRRRFVRMSTAIDDPRKTVGLTICRQVE